MIPKRVQVCHIITSLDTGGAEMMLYKLLSAHDRERFAMEVISLMPMGAIGEKIQALNVPVRSLNVARGAFAPSALPRLKKWLRESQPDVVQTWMYHADLVGGLAARWAGVPSIFWNIRNSTMGRHSGKQTTYRVAQTCARLSRRIPKRIVCCSSVAVTNHAAIGYAQDRFLQIPNGFDLSLFRPDPAARISVREEFNLAPEARLIGLVARFHPQKDHETFVRAAGLLHRFGIEAHYLLCGDGIDAKNEALAGLIAAEQMQPYVHLLGRRQDVPRLSAALDVAASSSAFGEAFPNVLGEAMACGVPCVATEVGESPIIVGDTGKIVPIRDPQSLADALREVLTLCPEEKRQLGAAARRRVEENFNLPDIVARYEHLYLESI
jgi:glycosyltransferase involved in cell wall biosynthesis